MKTPSKQLLINSSLAFVLAGLLATTFHELAHFVTALLLDKQGLFHPAYVGQADGVSKNHQILVAAAGPLFSLISGVTVIGLCRARLSGFWSLVRMWFGFLSAEIGFGYFIIAPFAKSGDTGQVLDLLHSNFVFTALVCAFGALGTYYLLPKIFGQLNSVYVTSKKEFFQLGMYPWLIGSVILVVVYLISENVLDHSQTVSFLSIIGTATIGIFTPIADYKPGKAKAQSLSLQTPAVGLIVTAILIVILFLLSPHGIAIGSGHI